ncbi:MAG: VanW family protein [Clostridia bacterium]|nr:VanW family protein [Clostridia bacterium]
MRYTYPIVAALLLIAALMFPSCSLAVNEDGWDTGTDVCLYDFMESANKAGKPRILYTGKTNGTLNMRSSADRTSPSLGVVSENKTVDIFGFDQEWLFCWRDDVGVYYLLRHYVDTIEPVEQNTAPYGVIKNRFVATVSRDTVLRTSPDEHAEKIDEYPAGTRLSFWMIEDGWAVVPYKRVVGYIYVGDLCDLTPVAPDVADAQDGDILAAFTTFYSIAKTELNVGRIENLIVGCRYIQRSYMPGEEFDFNNIAGPYRSARGYKPSPVLIDGGTVAGYGGGTCQVSTTLYNALLQLYDGITILWRRPHGPGGAKYAPHGVDAAVGAVNLNLEFRNDYDFPITLDCSVLNGALCICIRKGTA